MLWNFEDRSTCLRPDESIRSQVHLSFRASVAKLGAREPDHPLDKDVGRAGQRDRAWLFKLPMKKRLGGIPIPLRKTDRDVVLDLQALVDQIYANGRYADDLTYSEALRPALSAEDAKWAEQLMLNDPN